MDPSSVPFAARNSNSHHDLHQGTARNIQPASSSRAKWEGHWRIGVVSFGADSHRVGRPSDSPDFHDGGLPALHDTDRLLEDAVDLPDLVDRAAPDVSRGGRDADVVRRGLEGDVDVCCPGRGFPPSPALSVPCLFGGGFTNVTGTKVGN